MSPRLGTAGRLARAFVASRLTPLLIIASVGLGALAVLALPREEEPQIVVPMIDVTTMMPGASAVEVEQRLTRPIESALREIPGVEYVYSTSSPGQSLAIARFLVGQDETDALVRVNQKLAVAADRLPPGTPAPVVRVRSIDDVPVLAVTLTSPRYDASMVRRVAEQVADAVREVPDVSEVTLLGGPTREVRIDLDPDRLAVYGLDPIDVRDAVSAANARVETSGPVSAGGVRALGAGQALASAGDVGRVVVGSRGMRPVLVSDIAAVRDGDSRPSTDVAFHTRKRSFPAVTIAIAKRKGTNAIAIARRVEAKLDTLRGAVLPADVTTTITRDYGQTAAAKSNELLWHMLLAVASVSALIWFALGRREAAVVLVAIPVTLALTLFTFYLYGYTLNRITLFALIFSIGILVDDAIVVVENVVRHARLRTGESNGLHAITIQAVDEVGNPTILATLAVIAAILPMAFVGGLMGPYMRPIPVGASAAMVFSLLVAFVVTPWAAVRLLGSSASHGDQGPVEGRFTRGYRLLMHRLLASGRTRAAFFAGVLVLLLAAMALVPLGWVQVKMLPFDNKSEFQVLVDLPDGTALEETARVARALARAALAEPEVRDVQSYVGLASPYNFNGLVRHYDLRRGPHLADLQVNLVGPEERSGQSHAIARRVRDRLRPIAEREHATIQVAEVPPGPPVLQTLVAEIYGPDADRRIALARRVKTILLSTPGVVDVDWYVEDPRPRTELAVDEEKATAAGVPVARVAELVRLAADGARAGLLHDPAARASVPIVLRLPREAMGTLGALERMHLGHTAGGTGEGVSLRQLTVEREATVEPSVYHKNLQPVTYVTGDVAGAVESPVYAILAANRALEPITLPEGYGLQLFNASQPFDATRYAMKWDGEWHITIEVFRDLGLAFAVVLVLIYILVVGWFQSFSTPLTIMMVIPLSLAGILPAHAALGAFFTATSMIGFIAGAGIVVRNSIILVDFIELRLAEGYPLAEAVIDAGAVRFRPMVLTAAAVIVGSAVILFDPIFQGLAISLMAGEVASLLLSRVAVPLLYYAVARRRAAAAMPSPVTVGA